MSRVRRAGPLALPLALVLVMVVSSLATAAHRSSFLGPAVSSPVVGADVAWPASTLVISEIQTGGALASDEFAELANAGPRTVELMGLEVVYATSTGSTVTRKATWTTSQLLEPGRHLLIANAAGIHAGLADATYSGGFAATGGAVVLRPVGGTPIDAVAWGDASNTFVEDAAAPAPAAGSSIERLPGGAAGNGIDTNDNAADFAVSVPSPQNLASAPTPDPGTSPGPSPTPLPSVGPTPVPTPTPTPVPTSTPDPSPTPTPTPTPVPTPTPTPVPTPTPTLGPPLAIVDARAMLDGAVVRIAGTLTTDLGAIDSARNGFVQDGTAGIAIRLDAALATPIPAGTQVIVEGSLGSYFSLRVIGVAGDAIQVVGTAPLPDPLGATTGGADETLEGRRLSVEGTVTETPSALTDGLGVTLDDGSGPLRLIVSDAARAGQAIASGDHVIAIGPLGQRDSSGTGLAGHRLHATGAGELSVVAAPSPSPTAQPTPSPSPSTEPSPSPTPTPTFTPSPTATPDPSATPTPTPTASPGAVISIATARSTPVGREVTVAGVVTVQSGRLGTPALIAIQDATAGIVVRLPDATPRPAIGTRLEVTGELADPYGQLEIRGLTAASTIGQSGLPAPLPVDGSSLGEGVEGRLVVADGTVDGKPTKSTSGDIAFTAVTAHGPIRVLADATAGISVASIVSGDRFRLTGIAGQRASRKGAADGYRIWLRGSSDVVRLGGPTSPGASESPSAGVVRTIAAAILAGKGTVTIEGSVTTSSALLDATRRRVIVQDRTAAIEVLVPTGSTAPPVGARVRVSGEVGRAYGAPRIRATSVRRLGTAPVTPLELRVAPGAAHEWRLVRVRGDVLEVHRSGDRWTAELQVGGARIPISGLAGAAIPASALSAGRTASVVGIVRRPYPSASDRRFAIVPRGPADLTLGGAVGDPASSAGSGSNGSPAPTDGSAGGASTPHDLDLVDLAAHVGQVVRVGGLVQSVEETGFRLDDGTAVASIRLRAEAADLAGSMLVGDALSATGRVERDPADGEVFVAVDDPGGIALVGGLAPDDPSGSGGAGPSASDGPSEPPVPGSAGQPQHPALTAGIAGLGVPEIGALGLVLIGIASLAVTLLRRRRMRRRLAARIADRLATLVGTGSSPARTALATASLGGSASPLAAGSVRPSTPLAAGSVGPVTPSTGPAPSRAPAEARGMSAGGPVPGNGSNGR